MGARGFKYGDKDLTPNGALAVIAKPGIDGKAKITVKARGLLLRKPPMPVPAFPLRVQLQAAGSCWETKYDAIGVKENRSDLLKVKGPKPAGGGTCQLNTDCARPLDTSACGPQAFCDPSGQCIDPDQGPTTPCNPEDPPPPPFPGGCFMDAHCQNVGTCGGTAFCGDSQYCGDPGAVGAIAQACASDADCPASGTTGNQMVCDGGTTCIEFCGTTTRCDAPTVIPAEGGVFADTTVGGTSARTTCGAMGGLERTFQWTPATSGMATISTCSGAAFDTVVSIFQGIGCGGTVVACNDDFCSFQSTITPNVTAGTTYTIVVDGYDSGESGAFTLTVTPAP